MGDEIVKIGLDTVECIYYRDMYEELLFFEENEQIIEENGEK